MNEPREIDKCCQTMCNKHAVIKQIEELEAEVERLRMVEYEAVVAAADWVEDGYNYCGEVVDGLREWAREIKEHLSE